eukprot:CAMPEP_0170329664 /NCGR_PEP_ID=MMETSP0116_2-20130129/65753_1 /TAXON_ID=400756 /ORGANISM="Durinskia baltica, Strain CSIRO CS-38" /LENGTH=108 /DNA_ID=CAMNT_0010582809 /DNA_START=106 /DNA_END=432 /DNA_ORIENTATION=-
MPPITSTWMRTWPRPSGKSTGPMAMKPRKSLFSSSHSGKKSTGSGADQASAGRSLTNFSARSLPSTTLKLKVHHSGRVGHKLGGAKVIVSPSNASANSWAWSPSATMA